MNISFTKEGDKFIGSASISGEPFVVHVEADMGALIVLNIKTAGTRFAHLDDAFSEIDQPYQNGGHPAEVQVIVDALSETIPTGVIIE